MNDYPFGKQGVYNIKPKTTMNKKTILEWLRELPEPFRTQALDNTELFPYEGANNMEVESMGQAISFGFTWHQTPQKVAYWSEVHAKAEKGEFNHG